MSGCTWSFSVCSMSCSKPSFSSISRSIRFSYCAMRLCIFFVLAPIKALVLMQRSCSLIGSKPIFVFSFFSAQRLLRSAACRRDAISCRCFSFSASANWSFRRLFSHHEVKLPLCTSIEPRFKTRTWSMHASRRSRSCETRIKPFFFFKYSRTHALASWSRWFVGSSIRRKSFSPENRTASNTFVCSPKLKVPNGRYSNAASACRSSISISTRHSSHDGFSSSKNSAAVCFFCVSVTWYGK